MTRSAILTLLGGTLVLVTLLALARAEPQGESGKDAQEKPAAKKEKAGPKPKVGTVAGVVKNRWLRREKALMHVGTIKGMKFPAPKEPAVMDQENLVFKPHVLVILKGTRVSFPNSDSVRHNVYSPAGSAKAFNLGTYDAGVTKDLVFNEPGEVALLCNVHAEMSAYIVITETPFFVWTDRKGAFRIENVPVGKRRIALWHERFKPKAVVVEVHEGKTADVVFEKLKKR